MIPSRDAGFDPEWGQLINPESPAGARVGARYLLNERGFLSALDLSRNNNNGAVASQVKSGSIQYGGVPGPCFSFTGTGAYIDCGRLKNLFDGVNTALTVSAWLSATAPTTSNNDVFIGSFDTTAGNVIRCLIGNDGATNNHIQLLVSSGTWANNFLAVDSSATTLVANAPYHVVLCIDLATTANSKTFLNGVKVASSLVPNGTPPTVLPTLASNLTIGSFNTANAAMWFSGLIGNVSLWPYVVPDELAYQLYREPFGDMLPGSTRRFYFQGSAPPPSSVMRNRAGSRSRSVSRIGSQL